MHISSIGSSYRPVAVTRRFLANTQSVNFKADMGTDFVSLNTNKELYRGVNGEEEIDSLLSGGIGGFYATANSDGWCGAFPASYFITFKSDFRTGKKVEYDEYDKKFKLYNFTLEDIQNIRAGSDVSGKIIFDASMSDNEKQDFVQNRIKNHLHNIKNNVKTDYSYSCLAYYLRDYIPLVTGIYGRCPDASEIKNCDLADIENHLLNKQFFPASEPDLRFFFLSESKTLRSKIAILGKNDKYISNLENLKKIEQSAREMLLKKEAENSLSAVEKGALNTLRMLDDYDKGLVPRSYLNKTNYAESPDDDSEF